MRATFILLVAVFIASVLALAPTFAQDNRVQSLKDGSLGQLEPASIAILRTIQRHVNDSKDFSADAAFQTRLREMWLNVCTLIFTITDLDDDAIQKGGRYAMRSHIFPRIPGRSFEDSRGWEKAGHGRRGCAGRFGRVATLDRSSRSCIGVSS